MKINKNKLFNAVLSTEKNYFKFLEEFKFFFKNELK